MSGKRSVAGELSMFWRCQHVDVVVVVVVVDNEVVDELLLLSIMKLLMSCLMVA